MTQAVGEVETLLANAKQLLDCLGGLKPVIQDDQQASLAEAERVVASYADRLEAALLQDDHEQMLRACNALTSVNKGLGDTAWIDQFPIVSERALIVSHQAWTAGDAIRREDHL